MDSSVEHTNVQIASDDLRRRTLSQMPGALERMIYLASTRDYNNGLYYHDGLASRFSEAVACQALSYCHREAFRELLLSSLQEMVRQLDSYVSATRSSRGDFLAAWKNLEPYRVAIPAGTDPLAAEFLCSNIKLALTIWARQQDDPRAVRPSASPRPSPVQ
jgi:hypothetical protein